MSSKEGISKFDQDIFKKYCQKKEQILQKIQENAKQFEQQFSILSKIQSQNNLQKLEQFQASTQASQNANFKKNYKLVKEFIQLAIQLGKVKVMDRDEYKKYVKKSYKITLLDVQKNSVEKTQDIEKNTKIQEKIEELNNLIWWKGHLFMKKSLSMIWQILGIDSFFQDYVQLNTQYQSDQIQQLSEKNSDIIKKPSKKNNINNNNKKSTINKIQNFEHNLINIQQQQLILNLEQQNIKNYNSTILEESIEEDCDLELESEQFKLNDFTFREMNNEYFQDIEEMSSGQSEIQIPKTSVQKSKITSSQESI